MQATSDTRMTRLRSLIAALGLAAGVAGCDYMKNVVFDSAPPVPPPHAEHDLVIKDGKAYYNKTFIGPGVSVDVWKRLFGAPSSENPTAAYWTDMGLSAFLAHKPEQRPKMVSSLEVALEVFPKADPNDLDKAFPGRVLLDGAPLYKGVKMLYVNQYFRNDACKPPGGGVGLHESGLPGHYECFTPTYTYWLKVYQERRAVFVRRLHVQPK
jgi:hypothetical protein